MNSVLLTCAFCSANFHRTLAEHNRRLREYGENYIIRCKKCKSVSHNMFKSSEYNSWAAMKNRCDNPSFKNYDRYGGRGISYDSNWKKFSEFFKDMGEKPSPQHQLERLDNNKNYSKENCKWATRKEQTRNRGGKRATRFYTFNGERLCLKDWAIKLGISPTSLRKRIDKGWPPEKVFSSQKHDAPDLYTYAGKTMSLYEWAKYLEVKKGTLYSRLTAGHPLETVFCGEKFNRWSIKNEH